MSSITRHQDHREINMIQGLPVEVLREIIMELDCLSLRSVLEAFNDELKDMILVITDTVYKNNQLLFFHGLNLKTIKLIDFRPHKWKGEKPLIKIFELVDGFQGNLKSLWDQRDATYGEGKVHPFLDRYSIVYVNAILDSFEGLSRTDCVFRSNVPHVFTDWIGFEPHEVTFGPRRQSAYTRQDRRSYTPVLKGESGWRTFQGTISDGLKTLRIQYTNIIENLRSDTLQKLTIVFGNGDYQDKDSEPTIRNLKAPRLSFFSVHYYDEFPYFESVMAGDALPPRSGQNKKYLGPIYQFRLIQVDALNRALCEPLPKINVSSELVYGCDFSFTKNYESIHIMGGPDDVIEMMNFFSCRYLIWRQTHLQDHPHDESHQITYIPALALKKFTFDTLLNRTIVPRIITKRRNQLESFIVMSYALGTTVHHALRGNFKGLVTLSIHCWGFPKDEADSLEYPPLDLDLKSMTDQYRRLKSLRRLSVHGYCKFGDAPDRSDTEQYALWRERVCEEICAMQRVLKPGVNPRFRYGIDTLTSPGCKRDDMVQIMHEHKLSVPRSPSFKGTNRIGTTKTPATERLAESAWVLEHRERRKNKARKSKIFI